MSLLHAAPFGPRTAPARAWWLLVIALAAVAALWLHGPIAQWAHYHAFADARAWGAIPNAANVLSNLPFLVIGAWGLWRLRWRDTASSPALPAWRCLAVAVVATAFGSAAYHWAPSGDLLALDRLPIAWGCAALLCALLAERVDRRWAHPSALAVALLLGSLSVALWWMSERNGQSDLRAYAAVQFLPMLLIPAALALQLPPTHSRVVGGRDWCVVLALYAAAKAMEAADHAVLSSLGLVSGHTLKHLLAAAAAAWLLRAVISSGSRR